MIPTSSHRILITGTTGFLGSALARSALDRFSTFGLFCTDKSTQAKVNYPEFQVDIRDASQIDSIITNLSPAVIIHCAAYTGIERCANNPTMTWNVNVHGTENVAKAAEMVGAKMVYVSTDAVFDGEQGYCSEQDSAAPKTTYGKSKLFAEQIVSSICKDYCIGRISLIFGVGSDLHRCFTERMIQSLSNCETIQLFRDEYKSLTYLPFLCNELLRLAESNLIGIYHLGGPERISRFDFGIRIAEELDLEKQLIIATSIDDFSSIEPRARDVSLDSTKLSRDLGLQNQSLEVSINDFCLNYKPFTEDSV